MRFQINIDGKWRGDSYATQNEAESVAKVLRNSTAKKVEVTPKGGIRKSDPKKDEKK